MTEIESPTEEQGIFWTHALCGRKYDDADPEEVARWNILVIQTGFCCDDCRETDCAERKDAVRAI